MTDNPSLLTVDVDAHLQKLAAHTYRSHDHYPVELIRSALKRQADKIKIMINSTKVDISDNGSGISSYKLTQLTALLDVNLSIEGREKALEDFQADNGLGLLAIFSPSPERIEIENMNDSGQHHLVIQHGEISFISPRSIHQGTRIILHRKKKDWSQEALIIKDYCQFVEVNINLNGNSLKQHRQLANSMVTTKLFNSDSQVTSWIGIPCSGDICSIWLMDQKIPWHHATIYPYQGFIFEAAIETRDKLNEKLLKELTPGCRRLYEWLTNHFSTYPPKYKKRIEEIVFKHHRLTHDHQLINSLSCFKSLQPASFVNLAEILQKSKQKQVFIIPEGENLAQYSINNRTVLHLSQSQIDFLSNSVKIPIHYLSPIKAQKKKFRHFIGHLFKSIKKYLSQKTTAKKKILDPREMMQEETNLLNCLNEYLDRRPPDIHPFLKSNQTKIRAYLIDSRGVLPVSTFFRTQQGKSWQILLVKRKHPLIKKAIRLVNQDPNNIEFIVPLFLF